MRIGMDTIQFIEEVLNIKLLDYQKRLIKEMEKHPDHKVRMPRSRTTTKRDLEKRIAALEQKWLTDIYGGIK